MNNAMQNWLPLTREVWAAYAHPQLRQFSPEFSALVEVESGGNPDAVSPVGAAGLTQIMPETAAELGFGPADRFNPRASLVMGALYLNRGYHMAVSERRLQKPAGPVDLIACLLAGYNTGHGRVFLGWPSNEAHLYVNGLLHRQGLPLTLENLLRALPLIPGADARETVPYVKKILKLADQYR